VKTAFKLLLLSASFLSANLFAESEWVSTNFQPGHDEFKQVVSVTMSADGQIILIAESITLTPGRCFGVRPMGEGIGVSLRIRSKPLG
jgi:hypothetical protein